MYPLYFYICFLASVASVVTLILLAIFPVKLPFVAKTTKQPQSVVRTRKARSPTRHPPSTNYWDPPWTDDEDDL
mgnify:CR=1 FL=1